MFSGFVVGVVCMGSRFFCGMGWGIRVVRLRGGVLLSIFFICSSLGFWSRVFIATWFSWCTESFFGYIVVF